MHRRAMSLLAVLALYNLLFTFPITIHAQEYRSIDGRGNNPQNPALGSASTPFTTIFGPGTNATANALLPDPRAISNALAAVTTPILSPRNLSTMFTFWGEFLTLDISHIGSKARPPANIVLPSPGQPGTPAQPANESFSFGRADTIAAPPSQPINYATSFLDASHIYGTDTITAQSLRAAGGKLALQANGLPPFNDDPNSLSANTVPVAQTNPSTLFRFGLINGNTHPMLQALMILFMREHNRYVDQIAGKSPSLDAETLYQKGRQHVNALIQHITYYDYLPALFGENPLPPILATTYDPSIDPSVNTLFSAAALRYGHMEVQSTQVAETDMGVSTYNLMDAFYNTDPVVKNGILPFFYGQSKRPQLHPTLYIVAELRNVLFRNRPMDLFAIDIERGREFGLPSYNDARKAMSLTPVNDFAGITKDTKIAAVLQQLYQNDVNRVDLVIGGLAEDHLSSNVGLLFQTILAQQFRRIRDGDRLWFERDGVLDKNHLVEIRNTTLRDLIIRNVPEALALAEKLPSDVFRIGDRRSLDTGNPPNYDFHRVFLNNAYKLSWKFESVESIRVRIECASDGWCGLGFGQDMTVAEFVIIHLDANGEVVVEERKTSKAFSKPVAGDQSLQVISRSVANGVLTAEFRRGVRAGSGQRYDVTQTFLVAYNPQKPPSTTGEDWFQSHGSGSANRVKVYLNLMTNQASGIDNVTTKRNVHALGMTLVWGFVFPLGVFWGRYMRHTVGWMVVHIFLQTFGTVAAIILAVIPLVDSQSMGIKENAPHSYIGIALLVLLIIQLTLGIFNWQRLQTEKLRNAARYIRTAHHAIGGLMLVLGLVNMGCGLLRLYPTKSQSSAQWLVYFFLVALWVVVLGICELFFKFNVRARGNASTAVPAQVLHVNNEKGEPIYVAAGVTPIMPAMAAPKTSDKIVDLEKEGQLMQYTWKEIGAAVLKGQYLVVGNGRWVYDIQPWLAHHPGGRVILETVNGTDITIDFFNESDFDGDLSENAITAPAIQKQRPLPNALSLSVAAGPHRENSGDTLISTLNADGTFQTGDEELVSPSLDLTAEEWKAIRKARWTHAHSKYAAQKLIKFMVGQITPTPSSDDGFEGSRNFDPFEYRRYTIVSKQVITAKESDRPIWSVKFALLYPLQGLRTNEPKNFFPGQCIEVFDRIGGQAVSRFYSPVSGDPSCFEVHIKVYPNSLMGRHIEMSRPGSRQMKIRGPFAMPLVNPERPISSVAEGYWQTVVLICGGTGISPALQFVREYLLPVGRVLVARERYAPVMDDEIGVNEGDRVRVLGVGMDGWATGMNLVTDEEGLLPLSFLIPPAGLFSRIVILNAQRTLGDITGRQTLQPAALAYPDLLQIHHFISNPDSLANVDEYGVVGYVNFERISVEGIWNVVAGPWSASREGSRKCVICGPAGLESAAYDALVECGVESEDIVVLPPDSYHGMEQDGMIR